MRLYRVRRLDMPHWTVSLMAAGTWPRVVSHPAGGCLVFGAKMAEPERMTREMQTSRTLLTIDALLLFHLT